MSKTFNYLDVDWTPVVFSLDCMITRWKSSGYYGNSYLDITVPDPILHWLYEKTGEAQSSYITDSNWWWDQDKTDKEAAPKITFYFRDPAVALQFKLTWGTVVALQD